MPIFDQSKYPPITSLGSQSVSCINLPIGHPAYLHPMQIYIWSHDLFQGILDIFETKMPSVQSKRYELLKNVRFMEDTSGRSTGKSLTYLYSMALRAIMNNYYRNILLGQEAQVGIELFDKIFKPHMMDNDNFSRFFKTPGRKTPRVSNDGSTSHITTYSGSIVKAMTPDPQRQYKKMQSWRFNDGILNEVTSWPHVDQIIKTVEPIFTNATPRYVKTRAFRERMEEISGVELGSLTNEILIYRHQNPGYVPRENMIEAKILPWDEIKEKFYGNFDYTYGFEYKHGMDNEQIGFEEITSMNDIIMFFRNYDEGDGAYFNKLVYDGSAKKPSDDSYLLHKYFISEIEAGNQLYAHYSIGVDDIPIEYDGIIYESAMVEKARRTLLKEEFQRVWNGKWVEGRSKKPFTLAEILACQEDGYLGRIRRESLIDEHISGIDSAQGTDAQYSTEEGIKDGRGDDGAETIWKVGLGTPESPHELCLVSIAEDVRSEIWALEIQNNEKAFQGEAEIGCIINIMDPGGGGKATIEKLAKRRLEVKGIEYDFDPLVPYDHQAPLEGSKRSIVMFSLSNEMIKTFLIDSKTGKVMMQQQDQLNNYMVTRAQALIRKNCIKFPQYLDIPVLNSMHNEGEIDDDMFINLINVRTALNQLLHLEFETDKNGKKVKTKNGVYRYVSKGKKDVALAILYGIFGCDLFVKLNSIGTESNQSTSSYIPVIG